MRGFLYIYQKVKENHDPDRVMMAIDELKQTNHTFEYNENETLKTYQYTNEGDFKQNSIINSKFISLIGQFVEDESSIRKSLSNLLEDDLTKYVSQLRGAFALAIADMNINELKFFTHVFRIDNIFYRETAEFIVVGTDPLVVSSISNKKITSQK